MLNKQSGTIKVATFIDGEGTNSIYHAKQTIACKYLGKNHTSIKAKAKGEAFFIKDNKVADGGQWYFKPKGEEDYYRVKWYNLDCNVEIGNNGAVTYQGMNPKFKGKKGEAYLSANLDWLFLVTIRDEGEDVNESVRVNPESLIF